jgi:hypothetical protein
MQLSVCRARHIAADESNIGQANAVPVHFFCFTAQDFACRAELQGRDYKS